MSGAVSELRAKFTAQMSGFKQAVTGVRQELQGVGDEAVNTSMEANRAFDGMKGSILKLGGVFAGLGTAVAGGIGYAINVTDQYQKALNGVSAQTGATEKETAQYGDALKNIYANNYGADFAEIGESLATVKTNTGLAGKELEVMTQNGLMLRDTMQYEVADSTRTADTMMKQFGISGDEAFTLIAQGHQKGLDKSGDMLDTFNEYSVYFKTLGFDAEGMFNVISSGMKAGAKDSDLVADAVKELGIRVKDGSDGTAESFKAIGLNADATAQAFAKGGDSSQKALSQVFAGLAKIEDPIERNSIGVSLFGTQFEDLEYKTISALGKVNNEANKSADTLKKIDSVKYNTVGEALTGIKRKLDVELIDPIQTKVMPTVNKMMNSLIQNLPALKKQFSEAFNAIVSGVMKFAPTFESLFTIFKNVGGWLGSTLVVAFSALSSALSPIVNTITSIVGKFTEWEGFVPILNGIVAGFLAYKTYMLAIKAPMLIMTALTRGWAIVQGLLNVAMAMNPIGLIIALLVGLGVALYTAYKKSETFRNIINGAWSAIKAGAMAVFNWLVTNIPIWINNLISGWNNFKTMLSNLWSGIVEGAKGIWGGLVSFFTGIVTGIQNVWNGITSFFTGLWNGIVSFVMPIINGFVNMITQAWSNFVGNITYLLAPIKDFFINTWNNIKLMVLSIIGVFLNLITGNMEGLKISLTGIWEAIKRQIVNIVTTLKELAIRAFTLLKTGVITIFTAVKDTAVKTWNGLKTIILNTINALKTGAINTINALKTGAINSWNALKAGVINSVNALKNGAINSWNALKSGVVNTITAIKNGVINGFNTAKSTAINAINAMKSGISNGINAIKGFFTTMKSSITGTLKGINLASIGKNIIQGLINGISGMIGKVKEKISNLASTVTGGIKKALSIHSPSRVMRDLGAYVGEGLAVGIDGSKRLVEKTTQGLAESAMIDPANVGIGSLTGDTLTSQVPSDPATQGKGSGSGVTTNYQAPLMNIENYYDNTTTDKRELANGLYRMQEDHNRARGKRT